MGPRLASRGNAGLATYSARRICDWQCEREAFSDVRTGSSEWSRLLSVGATSTCASRACPGPPFSTVALAYEIVKERYGPVDRSPRRRQPPVPRIGMIERCQGAQLLGKLIIHRLAHGMKAMGADRLAAGDQRRPRIVGEPEPEGLPAEFVDARRDAPLSSCAACPPPRSVMASFLATCWGGHVPLPTAPILTGFLQTVCGYTQHPDSPRSTLLVKGNGAECAHGCLLSGSRPDLLRARGVHR